jgi:putative ABC transport system permease protein
LSLALLVGGVALRDSFHRIMGVDAGYDMSGVVAADVLLYLPPKEALPVIDRFVTRLRQTSGIEAVGLVHSTPLTGKWTFKEPFEVLDGPQPVQTPPISGGFVGYDYFAALGVPLLAGRTFAQAEFTGSRQRVMIVNDVAARMYFPNGQALGARIRMDNRTYEIIGVTKGTRNARLDTAAEPQWFQPAVLGSSQVIVRGTGSVAATADIVRQALYAADPRIIVERVEPLETIASESVIERRLASQLVSAFAAIAVVLAGIGLYGVVHFASARRQREFGIRMAIGGRPSDVLTMVVRQGVLMAVAGVILGALVSLSVAGMLQSLLFEARAAEPSALLYASLTLLIVAAIASLPPAWRAASVDPASVLRSD